MTPRLFDPARPTVPLADPELAGQLAALVAGEGSFIIEPRADPRTGRRGGGFATICSVDLRMDDEPWLRQMQRLTGLGRLYRSAGDAHASPMAHWKILSLPDCRRLCRQFERFGLPGKKKWEFLTWRDAVRLRTALAPIGSAERQRQYIALAALASRLKRQHAYAETRIAHFPGMAV